MANPYQRAIFVLWEISKIFFLEQWQKINKMVKTMFKSIFKFWICSYFMYFKVLIGNNMRLYFWKFSQIKNRTQVKMGHNSEETDRLVVYVQKVPVSWSKDVA